MYLVIWFDSGWNEVVVQEVRDVDEARKLVKECENDMNCIDPKCYFVKKR